MNSRRHFIASVIVFVIARILIPGSPLEVAKSSVLILFGYFPDIDKIPHSIKYHRNWLTHSMILPMLGCFLFNDSFFWIAGFIQAAHLLMDVRMGNHGGSYCIVKPSGDRMTSKHSTAWLVGNAMAFIMSFIFIYI